MSVSSINAMSEYISVISNPNFLSAVKSAAGKSEDSGKYNSLLSNLEKLSSLLSESSETTATPSQGTSVIKSISSDKSLSATNVNDQLGSEMDEAINAIIAHADLLEQLMNLEMEPTENIADLFEKFRSIIKKLDNDLREVHNASAEKEPKAEYKLRPSSSTKSGFQEGLTLAVR